MAFSTATCDHPVRCAVYTRKSEESRLDLEVNSLDAQRDVCSAYIKCNAHKGWVELPTHYDDAGFSGSTLERPSLQRLIQDIEANQVDVVVFYKIDRLTRSLSDFVRLIDALKRHRVAFASVTQSFDTSESMGRMILNILLTFAQFEREMLSDRIKDKFAVMRQRGIFPWGRLPLGYDRVGSQLVINPEEAATVRRAFEMALTAPTLNAIAKQLAAEGIRSKLFIDKKGKRHGGELVRWHGIYKMLNNPVYLGRIRDGARSFKGLHTAIIDQELWDAAHQAIASRKVPQPARNLSRNLLRGLLTEEYGRTLGTESSGSGEYYSRFYTSKGRLRSRDRLMPRLRVRADRVEAAAFESLCAFYLDHSEVKKALLTLGRFDLKARPLIALCKTAHARLRAMDALDTRRFFEAQIDHGEVVTSELRLFLKCREVSRFLDWGFGEYGPLASVGGKDERLHLVTSNANLVTPHQRFTLPIPPPKEPSRSPNVKLVNLLERAFRARAAVMAGRNTSIEEHATAFHLGPSKFARLLRLTYLAPDIQAAIVDGSQPDDLTAHKLIFSSLPLDWSQQRRLLGFDRTAAKDLNPLTLALE